MRSFKFLKRDSCRAGMRCNSCARFPLDSKRQKRTPYVFGFTVYESFESNAVAHTGVAPMPAAGETVLGGHAVMAAGYDDASQRFLVRNSWGAVWGMGGYFTLPYAYLSNVDLADDFWTIRVVK
jgi:C1A family cysteine protease